MTSANFQTNIPVNVPAFTGTNAAWVGITGSEGGILSHQTVSNFSYVPLPMLLSTPGGGNSVKTYPNGQRDFTNAPGISSLAAHKAGGCSIT